MNLKGYIYGTMIGLGFFFAASEIYDCLTTENLQQSRLEKSAFDYSLSSDEQLVAAILVQQESLK